MAQHERHKTYQPPTNRRTTDEMAAVADRARKLDAQMTPLQREALSLAGALYSKYSDTSGAGREFVIEGKVLKAAGTLIRFANGDAGAVDSRVTAKKLLSSKK